MFRMTSSRNQNKSGRTHDVFSLVAEIDKVKEREGAENVADAMLGVIRRDDGSFATIPTYEEVYRSLPARELCDYATIAGLPEFQAAAVQSAFCGNIPAGAKTEVVATPGGSGAVYAAILNYVEFGEEYLGPEWYWGPYATLGLEQDKKYVTYKMFDDNYEKFNFEAFKAKTLEMFEKQDSLLTIFNFPANNPSGYNLSVEEWTKITDLYREICKNPDKKVIVVWDWAYTDYAGTKEETRAFLHCFDNMPENMLLLCAYSMSKSFLIYGMRSGALIAVSTSDDVIEDFAGNVCFTSRSTWSNGSRGAQRALGIIYQNPELLAKVEAERMELRDMLINRGKIFMKEAKEIGLICLPHAAGFFITVPCKECSQAFRLLMKEEVYLLTAGEAGIRVAISSCPTKMVYGLAAKIKKCIDDNGFT